MKQLVLAVVIVFGLAGVASAQTVKNPTTATFTSADHTNVAVTGYEIDIIRNDGTVLQTLTIAKSSTTVLSNGDVRVTINVQPIAFGTYTGQVRAIAGALKSDNSPQSNTWDRVPGAPSKPVVQ